MGWDQAFDEPIALPGRQPLRTLRDAPEWQAAMEALLLVAERDGPTMFARIGMMRALHRASAEGRASAATEGGQGLPDRSVMRPRLTLADSPLRREYRSTKALIIQCDRAVVSTVVSRSAAGKFFKTYAAEAGWCIRCYPGVW